MAEHKLSCCVRQVVVCRAGLVGHQVNLTASGIEYVASQLQASPAASTSMAAGERRRLQGVARDAVAVFSDNRYDRSVSPRGHALTRNLRQIT